MIRVEALRYELLTFTKYVYPSGRVGAVALAEEREAVVYVEVL
jgi:hypothetical protein